MTIVVGILVVTVMIVAGRMAVGVGAWRPDGFAFHLVAGAVVIHLLLTALDLLGIGWPPFLLWAAVLLTLVIAIARDRAWRERVPKTLRLQLWRRSRSDHQALGRGERERAPHPGSWARLLGILTSTVAISAFAWAAWTLRSVAPDFVYHWGIKAKRYALAKAVDWEYLSRSWNDFVQPDYPNLFPEVYSLVPILTGRFDERWPMAFSVVLFGAILVAAWAALRDLPDAWTRSCGLAAVGFGCAAFSIGYYQAGGIDLALALAALLGARMLLQPGSHVVSDSGDAGRSQLDARAQALGFVCAFAAASKFEGVVLGALMLMAFLLGQRPRLTTLVRLVLPYLLVVGPWVFELSRRGLFQRSESSDLGMGRLLDILAALPVGFGERSWHGLSWLVVLAPILLLPRNTRAVGLVINAMLVFFVVVYWRSPVEPTFYVLSSWPRLVFQLWPATLVALLLAVGTRISNESKPSSAQAS